MNEITPEQAKCLADAARELEKRIYEFVNAFKSAICEVAYKAGELIGALLKIIRDKRINRAQKHAVVYAIGRPQRGYPRGIRATARSFLS